MRIEGETVVATTLSAARKGTLTAMTQGPIDGVVVHGNCSATAITCGVILTGRGKSAMIAAPGAGIIEDKPSAKNARDRGTGRNVFRCDVTGVRKKRR